MNENILLVHDCGSKLSRRHAEEAEGKVEILNWDNNSEASNLRKMANVQGAHGGFHTFPCYIFNAPDFQLEKILLNQNEEVIKKESAFVKGGTKKEFGWPSFLSFKSFYDEVISEEPAKELYMQFVLPEVEVDKNFVNEEGEVIETEKFLVPEENFIKKLWHISEKDNLLQEVSEMIGYRKLPIEDLYKEEEEQEKKEVPEVIDV